MYPSPLLVLRDVMRPASYGTERNRASKRERPLEEHLGIAITVQVCVAADSCIISGSYVRVGEDGTRQEWETEAEFGK